MALTYLYVSQLDVAHEQVRDNSCRTVIYACLVGLVGLRAARSDMLSCFHFPFSLYLTTWRYLGTSMHDFMILCLQAVAILVQFAAARSFHGEFRKWQDVSVPGMPRGALKAFGGQPEECRHIYECRTVS